MEHSLKEKINRNVEQYFPDKNFAITRITRVKTKPNSLVFHLTLSNSTGEQREIYAKQFGPERQTNINEIRKLKLHWDEILTPKIIDYFESDNIVLFERVRGNTLSRNLLLNSFRFRDGIRKKQLFECARKMGNAIGYLQILTKKESVKIDELNIFLIDQYESEEYVKKILGMQLWTKIQSKIEQFKEMKTTLAQYHGDPSPHNIIMNENDVFLLDFCYQTNAVFLDPVLFIVSLDLMRARFPFALNSTIKQMSTKFLQAYHDATNEDWDIQVWSILKFLTYLHILIRFRKRQKSIKNNIVASLDKRYLLKKIKHFT